MPAYDYALVRAVRVPTGDAVTVGVVLQSRQAGFLDVRLGDGRGAAARLGLDADLLARALDAFGRIAAGDPAAGPVARLPPSERFHFLTAARSTALQTSPTHAGLADDPARALDRIARGLADLGPPGTRPGAPGV